MFVTPAESERPPSVMTDRDTAWFSPSAESVTGPGQEPTSADSWSTHVKLTVSRFVPTRPIRQRRGGGRDRRRWHRQLDELRIVVGRLIEELGVDVDDVVAVRGSRVVDEVVADHDVVQRLAVAVEDVAVTLGRRQGLDHRVRPASFSFCTGGENWKSFRSPMTAMFAVGSAARRSPTKPATSVACWIRCTSDLRTGGCYGPKSPWSPPFELKWLTITNSLWPL